MASKTLRFFFLISYTILQAWCLKSNILQVAPPRQFSNFAAGSEAMVFARLALSEREGMFSKGGILLTDRGVPKEEVWGHNALLYLGDLPFSAEIIYYKSRPIVQTFLFSLWDMISPYPDTTNEHIFYWIISCASAVIFASFLYWVWLSMGYLSSILTGLGLLLSPWITISGGHLFWASGFFFLPFVYLAIVLHKHPQPSLSWKNLIVLSLLFFVKCLFNGYDLITSSLVMCTIPVFYYAFSQKWKLTLFFQQFIWTSASLLFGMLLSVLFLFAQISGLEENNKNGFNHIKERLILRTTGETPAHKNSNNAIRKSKEATLTETMQKYWSVPLFRIPTLITSNQNYFLTTRTFLAFTSILVLFGIFFSPSRPLSLTILISFLAPSSWFLLFKAHSFLHPFLDSIAWFLPTAILTWALIGQFAKIGMERLMRNSFLSKKT